MFDQWEQVNFFTEWNVRRGASTRVTPPPGRTGASKERLIPDEFYRHAALNLGVSRRPRIGGCFYSEQSATSTSGPLPTKFELEN
jgi:hypothetical protein